MSLQCRELRQKAVSTRQHDLTSITRVRATALLGLKAVHGIIQNNSPLSTLFNKSFDADHCSDDDAEFLQKFDLSRNVAFDSTALTLRPSPGALTSTQHHDDSISYAKPTLQSAESSSQLESSVAVDVSELRPNDATPASSVANEPANATGSVADADRVRSAASSHRTSPQPDEDSAAPANVARPLPEDEAQFDEPAQQLLDMQSPQKPAKVVHLPAQKVQEDSLREREAEEAQRRSGSESARSQRPKAPNADLASSPSSTVGAYSAATPGPPVDSPDTSPDSDSGQIEVAPPKELQPTPEQQREKEEHDRLLEAQKEIARKQALGDVATPDDQLRWEEREAAARSAEEQAARDGVDGPEPGEKVGKETTEAGEMVEDMKAAKAAPKPLADVAKEVPTEPMEEDDDEASIAVKPRAQTGLRVDTTSQQASPGRTESGTTPRMITRVSSGALRQKSVSEILGETSLQSPELSFAGRRESELISPLTRRHPGDPDTARSLSSILGPPQTPRESRSLSQFRLVDIVEPVIDELQVLKGAAEDPERDYLESLFRIQAHESPNSRTRTLPDLVGKGVKVLSTEDHYTALHERLDFRMLRRIYQLQNANKWSLRQMEKCKEPEEPVSHHDHMMQEMKWMRKDFRAEKRLKRSTCAWLAERCCEWVNADVAGRLRLQVKVKVQDPSEKTAVTEDVPELDRDGDSAPEDDAVQTPRSGSPLWTRVVVAPELADAFGELEASGKATQILKNLPKVGLLDQEIKHEPAPFTAVSRFIEGKILPKAAGPSRKRSRYDYDDEEEVLSSQPSLKRSRREDASEPAECALFQAENKPIRDRLHSNNAFRPPSEFIMPSTAFYEYRNGSQWIWEDDQKLRKLAKEYTFNWSLIADELSLQTRYKSSAERRTPWECFERWVELESLPADMRKTVYFKTWFNRLESSQQAAERRYQAQVTAIQQQAAANGGPTHIPLRRRTTPTRVEKRRSTRYLWMVDGFRKLAKKREQAAWKQAETARAAAQRKSQSETTNQVRQVKLTPQEFSKKRHERDVAMLEAARQHRAKVLEAQQQRQLQMQRAAQQQQAGQAGMQPGVPGQQRPPGAALPQQHAQMQANGQQVPNANGQVQGQQQGRPMQPLVRNGHLAVPNGNGQGVPQAQMQARVAQHPNMQQMQQANIQARNPQYAAQQFQMANGNMASPGGMTNQQQLQNNQALLAAAFTQQQQQHSANGNQQQMMNGSGQQMAASPSMPPPPTPNGGPQQLSSGVVPAITAIKTQLRAANPNMSQEQLDMQAMQQLKTMTQARQNAMNAAAGIPSQPNANMQQPQQQQAYNNQNGYQANRQMANGNMASGMYGNGTDGNVPPQANMTSTVTSSTPPQQQQAYAQKMMRMQQMQMQMQQQSPNQGHANLNGGSPALAHVSPNMAPASPAMQYSPNMNQMVAGVNGQQRPASRSNTPQMQRLGSSGSGVPGMNGNGMQSPNALQGSPRGMQANMARS
ncbi:unnamed protein product [Zymoseptoria tritici ST99CH_1A5]|uniref:Vacuolar import and degradation protein 21 n=1 Tax=Zymoseptoria tritici ST99CH_1A5 TaxID=1276529 RepID=A0A1Y6LNI6_ZYMTR|nr:unnamed protein product [Zymoseptoria tritici ST99CH_3D1]SMY25946.1 unnamed protein product [Zymoseptoria tritici ST99CH_1A5]